ncbi:MAG: MMPL family transporter [Fuerstiella sp.]
MSGEQKQANGILARCLGGISGFGARHPRLVLWFMVFLGCASVGITVNDLQLKTSRSDLLKPDAAWQNYSDAFGGESDLVVVVQTDVANAPLIKQALDQLSERLVREPQLFADVLCRLDQGSLRQKALQLRSTQELNDAQWLADYAAYGQKSGNWQHLQLDRWVRFLSDQIAVANQNQKSPGKAIAYSERFTDSLQSWIADDVEISPWPEYSSPALETTAQDVDVAYLMHPAGNAGFLRVRVADQTLEDGTTVAAMDKLRQHMTEVQEGFLKEAPDLSVAVTGISVIEADGMLSSGSDMLLAALISFIAVGLLLSFGLKGMKHPMLVLVMLVNSLAITFGVTTLAVGHLNMLSICFVAITIGLGVDFGIHFVTRYLHLRQELYETVEAIQLTGRSVGAGIFTSSATTAIAFGSAMLTGYPGLAELGIITALGVLVCAFQSLTFLPALISLSDEKVEIDELPVPIDGKMFRSTVASWPIIAICVSIIGVVAVAYHAVDFTGDDPSLRVSYDSNVLKLQDGSLPSVKAERVLDSADDSLLYAVALAGSREEAMNLRAEFLALPTVDRVTDLSGRLPVGIDTRKSQLIQSVSSKASALRAAQPTVDAPRLETFGDALISLRNRLQESSDLRGKRTSEKLNEVIAMLGNRPDDQRRLVDEYQASFSESLLVEFDQISRADSLEPIQASDLPVAWRNRYVKSAEDQQLWLLKVFPRDNVWSSAALGTFVGDLRAIDPNITGVPVQQLDASKRMLECYQLIGLYSLAAIALFLLFDFLRPGQKLLTIVPPALVVGFVGYTAMQRGSELNPVLLVGMYLGMVAFIATVFDFRNLRDTLIALITPVGGGLMLLGLMALLNIDFNPINLIVLPLVLGIGVDDGVHMVHDYRRQLAANSDGYVPSSDTVNGVLLTSLTSIIGFGSLMVSSHGGLKSVGVVLAIGVACCLVVALILLPAILVLVARHQPASLEPIPVTFRRPRRKKAKAEDETKTAAKADAPDAPSENNDEGRRLSRKEKRRQNAA